MSDTTNPVDRKLIELLQQKTPEELSFEELDLLRSRLSESAELRQALSEYLQTESYLTQVLGNFTVSPDAIIHKAQSQQRASEARPWQWLLGIGACLLMAAVVGAVFVNALRPPTEKQPLAAGKKKPPEDTDKKNVVPDPAPPGPDVSPAVDPGDESGDGKTPPVEPLDKPKPPKFELAIPATGFVRGTVKIDNHEFGSAADIVIHSEGDKKQNVEYEFALPKDARYFLHLRYASGESRPLKGSLNYKKLDQEIAGGNSGGYHPPQQKWFTAGPFTFKKGKNVLKLERDGLFPHLSQLVISSEATISDATAPNVTGNEVIAKTEPWDSALAREPQAFDTICFDEFDTTKSLPQVPDLMRWFETVPNQQRKIGEATVRIGDTYPKCGELDGVFRLRSPWQENVALRLALENHNRLRIHFYHGTEGVTFAYYQDEGYTWCAYKTTRNAGEQQPATFALTSTDAGRAARSEVRFSGGPLEIRWQAGDLLLSRGDIVLLRAPLSAPPQDVYFDGKAAFIGIELVPIKDAPDLAAPPPVMAEFLKPAELDWHEQLTEKAQVIKHPDGSIELIADGSNEVGFISAPLNPLLPCEVIVELSGATPGSGVFLTADQRKPEGSVRFLKNSDTKPVSMITMLRRDEFREGGFGSYRDRATTHVSAQKQFVRMIGGAGTMHYAIGADDQHFAAWEAVEPHFSAGVNSVALTYTRGTPDCRIKLHRITLRALPALAALADTELLQKVPVLTSAQTPTITQWIAEVTTALPAGVDASAWQRTAALRALAKGCDTALGVPLIRMLLDDAEARGIPYEQQLALYSEAALLTDTRNGAWALELWQRYFKLAERAQEKSGVRPYSLVRQAVTDSPVWFRHNYRVADEKTIRLELAQLLYEGKWNEVLEFSKMLRFYQGHQQSKLAEWAEVVAARERPGRASVETNITRKKSTWRPLLVEELSKDAYNVLAEMQAVLDSDAYEDAARMITSISPDAVTGVAPHGRDRQLLVALPSAIRLAVRQYPQLQAALNEKFGSLAQLRVKQSINANNVAAVELAAVQFATNEAAADAHRWLGDRALSSGWFARALAEYERATHTATSSAKHDLEARMRLAAAMQGSDLGQPVTRPVIFGEMTISPQEFEAMVADMRQANAATGGQRVIGGEQRVFPAPKMQGYELQQRPDPGGHGGESPNDEITRDIRNLKINWWERQLATVVEGNVLYVSNRFHVGAFDLNNGQRLWMAENFPGNRLRARDWSLIPMRPLVTNKFIYARVLYGTGPMLVCLDKTAGGKLVWTSEQPNNEFVVSDPLLIQDQLVALTMTRGEQGQGLLRLTKFDRDTGEPQEQTNLVRVNDVWWTRRACEVTALDDAILATLGGVSVCCDLSGNVRWIRKHVSLPPEEETAWVKQSFERPLVIGDKAYLTQPSVRSIECVDVDTGRLIWSQVLPEIETLVGEVDGKLILRTADSFLALQANDGKLLWRHSRPAVFDAIALGGPNGLLYVQKQSPKDKKDRFYPVLVWVDLNTGIAQGTLPLPQLENSEPHFGPLVTYNDRIWTWYENGNDNANRKLWELVPKADVVIATPAADSHSPWAIGLEPALLNASERLLPHFPLLAGGVNGDSGQRDEAYGERDVLGVCVRPKQPILFACDLPASDKSPGKLRIRFAFSGDNVAAKMSVLFAGETLWSESFDPSKQPQQWKDLEVDLAKCAGKAGTLLVRMDFVGDKGEMATFWKKLAVAP